LKNIQDTHQEFNELCKSQLIDMNTNKINSIEDRKGDEGWQQHVDGDALVALSKSFEFDSFEEGQAFVQCVSAYADSKDHHPEWKSENGGTLIHVKLTSHFAGNTVSLLDYELAE
jgi:pterin-4a-carbinolamine dehydratase